jgi:hypothetical protein
MSRMRCLAGFGFAAFLASDLIVAENESTANPIVVVDSLNGTFSPRVRGFFQVKNCEIREVKGGLTPEILNGAVAFVTLGLFNKPNSFSESGAYSKNDLALVRDFVFNGGTLITGGFRWGDEKGRPKELHPMNQLGSVLDFEIDSAVRVEKFTEPIASRIKGEIDLKNGSHFSWVKIKGSSEALAVANDGSVCGAAAIRGKGKIFVFGSEGAVVWNTELLGIIEPRILGQSVSIVGSHQTNKNQLVIAETDSKDPVEILVAEAPNAIKWATSPLKIAIPDELRQNIVILREDILDQQSKNSARRSAYERGAQLCNAIIAVIDTREVEQSQAQYSIAKRSAYSPLSNQALEARRNYKMSWPQYEREVEQRTVLREKKSDNIDLETSKTESEWITSAVSARKKLDEIYQQFRNHLRN